MPVEVENLNEDDLDESSFALLIFYHVILLNNDNLREVNIEEEYSILVQLFYIIVLDLISQSKVFHAKQVQ
jgi:hypothetical protein